MADAVKAGMDIICTWPMEAVNEESAALRDAVQQGILSEADVDRSVRRLFTARMKLGMFDPPSMAPYSSITISQNDTEPHRDLALKAARETLVLLKNKDNLLPLGSRYKRIAVIGPNADSVNPLTGNYNGTPSRPVTVLAGLRKRFAESTVAYAEGSSLTGPPLTAVPGKFLKSDSGAEGLSAEYFQGRDRQGDPVIKRTDKDVNFVWQDGADPQLKSNFSVRWIGNLVPPTTGDYEVGFSGTDTFRIWLDSQLIGLAFYANPGRSASKTVHLEAGRAYPIKIEYSLERSPGYAKLVWHEPGTRKDYPELVSKAEVIIAVLGLTSGLEGEEMPIKIPGFSGGDRTNIDLPQVQQDLLRDLVASGKPVVLVLMNGSALAVNWADEHLPAILEAWYPGEEGGTAVAEALAGDFSPSGKLPVTFYKSADQLPPFDNYDMRGRTYRYFTGEPLYPFGYGLSYTNFAFSNLKFDKDSLGANDDLTTTVDVKNTGKMAGDAIVQIYLSHPGLEGAPIRSLAGIRRLSLNPEESKSVSITIPNRNLSVVTPEGARRIIPGEIKIWAGDGQPVARADLARVSGVSGTVTLNGSAIQPK
jgi:beta-glucosidase